MEKDYRRLWGRVANAPKKAEAVRALTGIVSDIQGRAFVFSLESEATKTCIEILDLGITEHNLKFDEKQAFFFTLRKLAERHGQLPDRMIIRNIKVSDEVLASSGFGDVRSGTYMGNRVAVNTARLTARDNLRQIRKRFYREVILWERLSHPNVVKLVGVLEETEKRRFVTVTEWMAHGNIMEYIQNNHANRLELLHGAAQGLKYLHDFKITHGDLKGANILVSGTPPRACLAGFGFMNMVLDPDQPVAYSAQLEGGTTTFMSPELLAPQRFGMTVSTPTPEADIYAFGLVIFQVLTGEIPFHGVRQTELVYNVVNGKRPDKPQNASEIGFSDSLWNFTERCWDGQRGSRPEVGEVVMRLQGEAAQDRHRLMPPRIRVESTASDYTEEIRDPMEYNGFCTTPSEPEHAQLHDYDPPSSLFLQTDQRESPEFRGLLNFGQ